MQRSEEVELNVRACGKLGNVPSTGSDIHSNNKTRLQNSVIISDSYTFIRKRLGVDVGQRVL